MPLRNRRLRHSVALLSASLATLAWAPSADAVVTQLGTRPAEGGAGLISGTVSPTIVRAGENQTVTMNTQWSTFYSPNAEFGPVIWRTSTMSLGGGNVVNPSSCITVLYYAGSTSCEVTRPSATGGWRTAGFTITLNNGSSATYQTPYAVLPPDVYNITGRFMRLNPAEVRPTGQQVPAPGVPVIVEKVGGSDKYTTTTNADGKFDVQVEEGTWRVRSTDRAFCWDGSGATCQRQPTTTTPGDRTVNFSAPKPVKISGTVRTSDGKRVKDAWILAKWTDADGNPRRLEDKTPATGEYVLEGVDTGSDVTLSALDENVCVALELGTNELDDAGRCRVKERVITPQVDTTIDFTKPGCISKIDYQTSMQAVGECFETTDPEVWETTKTFRMNGLDFTPHGEGTKATFDSARRTVAFEGGGWFAITLPFKGASVPVGAIDAEGEALTFETALTKTSFSIAKNGSIPKEAKGMKKLAGFPVTAQESIEMLPAGVSTVAVRLAFPRDFAAQHKWSVLDNAFKDAKGEASKTVGVTAKVTTDNTSGGTTIEAKLDGVTSINPTFKKVFDNKLFGLSEARVSYNSSLDQWTIGGKVALNFLKGKSAYKIGDDLEPKTNYGTYEIDGVNPGDPPRSVDDEIAKTLDGTVTTTGIPGFGGVFENATFSFDGLNKRGPFGLYFQRGGATIPLRLWDSNGAGKASIKLGASVGPRNALAESRTIPFLGTVPIKPSEWASLDGELSASWSNLDITDTNPMALTGKFDAKVWDQPVGNATLSLYPNQGLIGGSLNLGFTDPTGGSLVSVRSGLGEFWYDQRRQNGIGAFYVWARTNMTVRGHGVYGDVIIEGPAPTRVGACGLIFGIRMGGVYDYDKQSLSGNSTCDLSAFKADKPVPIPPVAPLQARRAAAGATKAFRVRPDQEVVVVRVATAAGGPGKVPSLELRGPGVRRTLPGDRSVSTNSIVTLLDPLESSMTIVLKEPGAGTWTVGASGKEAPALAAPTFASPLPDPEVTGQIDASQCSPKVSWSARGVKDQALQFVERTAVGTGRVLGTVTPTSRAAKGTLAIAPLPGGGRAEVSVVVSNGGTPRRTIELGSYSSAASAALPGPSAVTFAKAKSIKVRQGKRTVTRKAAQVRWPAVCGATGYRVQVGKRAPVTSTTAGVIVERPKRGQAVTVTTLGPGGPAGSTQVPFAG